MRILVVDDVGYVRHYFDRLLTQSGHLVWTAASGFQAIEILKKNLSIQVVITDLLMPGMDGLELFRAAQKIDRHDETGALPRQVFYLITALRPSAATPHRESNKLQQALQLGFTEVLLKPINNEHLLRQLEKLERTSHPGDAVADAAVPAGHADLLHAIDQNVERLLCCDDRAALAELTDFLNGTLSRIPQIVRQLDLQSVEPATDLVQALPEVDSQDEAMLATEPVLAAENGLSTGIRT